MKTALEEEVENVPLSKSFPAPNYKKLLESGIEQWKVDAVRALRDAIPNKPRKYSWRIMEWTEQAAIMRDMSISILENEWTKETFSSELEKMKKRDPEYESRMDNPKKVAKQKDMISATTKKIR